MNQGARKVALVTGASRGIGKAIALQLVRDGYAITVGYGQAADKAEAVVNAIQQLGGQAIACQANVADAHDVEQLFTTTRHHFGRVDVVVSNAGTMRNGPIAAHQIDDFDETIAVNLRGTYLVLAHAAEALANGGRIIAISTSVIAKAMPNYGAYIASKAGVEGLVRVLANELRGRQITVNAVAPGPVETDFFTNGKSEELIGTLANMAPLERLGQPDDVAQTVAFLTSGQGGWINAQVIRANGGFA